VTLDMRAWLDRADNFTGLPRGTPKPFKFLYAFKEAEPHLGLPAHSYKLIDWLFRFTNAQDWEEGSRPISWPEARRQEEFLGLSPRRVGFRIDVTVQPGAAMTVQGDEPGRSRSGFLCAQG
jgi:replication initiation protein RepC